MFSHPPLVIMVYWIAEFSWLYSIHRKRDERGFKSTEDRQEDIIMKKIAISLFALAAATGTAFAAADDHVKAFEHNPPVVAETIDANPLAEMIANGGSDIPNYINRAQLR
jgi:hypothetical protein